MNEQDAPKFGTPNSLILTRRRFISQTIESEGRISEPEIQIWLEKEWKDRGLPLKKKTAVSLKAIRTDIDFIKDFEDREIFEKRDPLTKEFSWIDNDKKHGETRGERLLKNYKEKSHIAEMLSSLILGFKKFKFVQKDDGDYAVVQNLEEIRKQIEEFNSQTVMKKFEKFWKSNQRSFFLDSGTTTHVFAEDFLKYFPIPMIGEPYDPKNTAEAIHRLEVITNDRHIFYRLGSPSVKAKSIICGGRQHDHSATISGKMAENFLRVNDINAGMAIITTSALCLVAKQDEDDGADISYVAAPDESTTAIKQQFLSRSFLRIVVADSSKFRFYKEHGDLRVCSIRPNEIDLVLTDKAGDEEIQRFKDLGVPLIRYDELKEIPSNDTVTK